jgi:hypothetical protein
MRSSLRTGWLLGNIRISNDNISFDPFRSSITDKRVTRWMPYKKQELTHRQHQGFTPCWVFFFWGGSCCSSFKFVFCLRSVSCAQCACVWIVHSWLPYAFLYRLFTTRLTTHLCLRLAFYLNVENSNLRDLHFISRGGLYP